LAELRLKVAEIYLSVAYIHHYREANLNDCEIHFIDVLLLNMAN